MLVYAFISKNSHLAHTPSSFSPAQRGSHSATRLLQCMMVLWQNPALGLTEAYTISLSPSIQPEWIPL